MSVILRLGAVNTDTPYSRIISNGSSPLVRESVGDAVYSKPAADTLDYDMPLDLSPGHDDPYQVPSQTYAGCFGLPYQDHNYGAPPPPSPPRSPPPPVKVKPTVEDAKEEIVVTSETPPAVPPPGSPPRTPPSPSPREEEDIDDPTRCICDFVHDDGYMIQCDECSVWQHIWCMGLDRDSIPDTYLCELCRPRPVDRVRARDFQIRKREFLKNLLAQDSSATDTDPEEVSNRQRAYGLGGSAPSKQKMKMKLKKRKERQNSSSKQTKRIKKEFKKEKENNHKEANKKNKLILKDFPIRKEFPVRSVHTKKEKVGGKLRADLKDLQEKQEEEIRKQEEKLLIEELQSKVDAVTSKVDSVSADLSTISTLSADHPAFQSEDTQDPWDIDTFNEWEQNYEHARYNQYSTYVQEYLNTPYINGSVMNDIADLVTDGLRVQRCYIKELKRNMKGLQSMCAIPDGQPIIEVIGKIMTRQQYDKDNFGQRRLSPFVFFYGTVFDLDLVIDSSDYGNDARFIRRSCQPNAEVRHVVAGGQAHFITVARREITEKTEITIPFDYDYKKWNFCVECACLRNNCPVTRYQKRRLRFQKLQFGGTHTKKIKDITSDAESPTKSPVRSPIHSPVRTPARSPVRSPICSPIKSPIRILPLLPPAKKADKSHEAPPPVQPATPEKKVETPPTPSPPKMLRRSQVLKSVSRRNSVNASTQASSYKPLIVPPEPANIVDTSRDPITAPEPTSLRSSEVDILTSPEAAKTEPTTPTETQDATQPKKMTREERKMDAIMKAFEKMEKRQERRRLSQQAAHQETETPDPAPTTPIKVEPLENVDVEPDTNIVVVEAQHPPAKKKKGRKKKEAKVEKETLAEQHVPEQQENVPETSSPVKEEPPVPAISPIKEEVETEAPAPVEDVVPETKCPEAAVNDAEGEDSKSCEAEVTEELPVEVEGAETKLEVPLNKPVLRDRPPPKGRKAKKSSARRRARYSSGASAASSSEATSTSQDEGSNPAPPYTASCPATPLPSLEVAGTPPSFKFKKRHLMNEWLSERNLDFKSSVKTEPLEVTVPDDMMFVQCLPSPCNSMDRLRRNSQSYGPGGRPPVVTESSAGSAKKRWLRQAMGEGSSDSGLMSPGPSSGGMSPNPLASMPSPGGSPPTDFVTPLKKRRLARESLSRESFSSESPTQTPVQTPVIGPVTGSYFSLPDATDNKAEVARTRNGFRPFFSPLKAVGLADEEVEKSISIVKTSEPETAGEATEGVESVECVEDPVSDSNVTEACALPSVSDVVADVDQSVSVTGECRDVAVGEVDSSVITGSDVSQTPGTRQNMISEDNVVMSSRQEEARTLLDVEHQHGDRPGASVGRPEPDSSESTNCLAVINTHVECDSMGSDCKVGATGGLSEVHSTQNSEQSRCAALSDVVEVSSHQDTSVDSNSNSNVANVASCDSCSTDVQVVHSEDNDINVNVLSSSNSSLSDKLCSSSILTSQSDVNHAHVCDSAKSNSPQKSQVDSSTDKVPEVQVTTDSTSEVCAWGSSEFPSNSSVVSETQGTAVNSTANMTVSETGPTVPRMVELMDSSEQAAIDSSGLLNSTRFFPSFGFDVHQGTEMVVDSTTQPLSSASSVLGSGLNNLTAYDSDSMDVSSASDVGMAGVSEELRRSEESLSYLELAPSTSTQEMQPPKEKKKVSLQEYRKRVKKPSTTSTLSSISAALGKKSARLFDLDKMSCPPSMRSTLTPPIKLEKMIKLDKLPSLPSLPLFEPQHKEFKSSSDLLSPIFNRKERQEEVRKPLSLSERLKQEFGLDDYTDTDGESGTEYSTDIGKPVSDMDDPPPPPPPPPPSLSVRRASAQLNQSLSQLKMSPSSGGGSEISGSAISEKIQSLLSLNFSLLKKNHTSSITSPAQSSAMSGPSTGLAAPVHPTSTLSGIPRLMAPDSLPKMVPPPAMVPPPPGRPQRPGTPGALLPGGKTTIPSTNDLTEKLAAALKALKEQTALTGGNKTGLALSTATPMSLSVGQPAPSSLANSMVTLNNCVSKVTNLKPQVFDYGHRSGGGAGLAKRQNSYPSSTITSGSSNGSINSGVTSSVSYQGYMNLTPPNSHAGTQSNVYTNSANVPSKHYTQGYNSPHTPGSQPQHQPKSFTKQHSSGSSHKYSGLK